MRCKDASNPQKTPTPPAVKRFLDYIFVDCGLSGATVTAYQRDLNEFWSFLETDGVLLGELTLHDIQQHLAQLCDRGLHVRSIARHLSSIKMFLRFAREEKITERDISHLLETPRVGRSLPHSLSQSDVEKLLNSMDPSSDLYLRDKALIEFLYATGMRVSEVANTRVDDIDFKVGFLRCIGKGNKERIVPVGRYAMDAMDVYLQDLRPHLALSRPYRHLFLSRTGRPLDRGSIWRIVRKYGRLAGLPASVYPHLFRHSYATHLLDGGADLRTVQELLGHSDLQTTQIYTEVTPVRLKKVHAEYHPRQ